MNKFYYHDFIYNNYHITEINTDLSYEELYLLIRKRAKESIGSRFEQVFFINDKSNIHYVFFKDTCLSDSLRSRLLISEKDISEKIKHPNIRVFTKLKSSIIIKYEDII
jgi:hypothetical protein